MSPRAPLAAALALPLALTLALTLAPRLAAAALTWQPCAASTLGDAFGSWRCVSAITAPGDLEDRWANTARLDGDTMLLGQAIADDPLLSEWVVVERANGEWSERTRLLARRDADVQLRGDTIAILDRDDLDQGPRLQLYDRIDGAWTPTLSLDLPSSAGELPLALTDERVFIAVPGPPWSVRIHHRIGGAWSEEATVTLAVPDPESKYAPTLAADRDRLVAAFGDVVHVFRADGTWSEETTLVPDPLASPPEAESASIALDGDRLAVAIAGGDPGDHSKVLVYSPCAVDGGWGVDAVLDVPPAPTKPTLFLADGRLLVNTHEVVGPPGVFIGSARVFSARDGWALEAELFTPESHSNLEFAVDAFDGDALLADLHPATEPYFYSFELYTRPADDRPDEGTCEPDPGTPGADDPSGCGCTATTTAPSSLLLLLTAAALRRRRRP